MAHHWHAAHDSVWALIGAWRAAAQAGRAVAPAERLALLSRVLELWDQVPDAHQRIEADHIRVLEEAVEAAHDAGEYERGIALATSALRELDGTAEPVRVARLMCTRGRFRMRMGRADFVDDMERALEFVPGDVAPDTRISILLAVARCSPEVSKDRAYVEEALALARRTGDQVNEVAALLSMAMFGSDPGQEAAPGSHPLDLIAEARAMGERLGAEDVLLKAAVNESHLLEGAGQHELAAEAARRAVASADAQRLGRLHGGVLTINQAEPLTALGRWDEVLALASRAMELYMHQGTMHRASLHIIMGNIMLARGDLAGAVRNASAAREALRGARFEDQHQLPLARLETLIALASDGPAAAVTTTLEAADRYDLTGSSPRYAWPVVSAGADAVLAAARQAATVQDEGLRDQAAGLAERLRTAAEKLESFGPVQHAWRLTWEAADAHAMQVLAAFADGALRPSGPGLAGHDLTGLRAGWDEAAAAWEAVSEPYPQAQALLHAAEVSLVAGDREEAAQRLQRAASLTSGLAAPPLDERIAGLTRRARIRLASTSSPSPVTAGGSPSGEAAGELGLTGREFEVLRLVVAGRSNRDIAAELFISPKTASVHVSNILGKLGVATRGEAAAKAHTLGLFDP